MLSGHLCRCTGYAGIVAAVLEAAAAARPEAAGQSAEQGGAMADVFGKHALEIPYRPIADLLARYRAPRSG